LAGALPVDQLAPLAQSLGPVAAVPVACDAVALPDVVTVKETRNGKPAVSPESTMVDPALVG
jgi:hypothetical protein